MTAQWRRAPFALAHHRVVLLALFVAAGLVALAASSAPFLSAAAGSAALKNELVDLTPLSTGLVIETDGLVPSGSARRAADAARRDAAVARLAQGIGSLGPPLRTLILGGRSMSVASVTSAGGEVSPVVIMSRDGALGHVAVVSWAEGPGVWISDVTAKALRVQAGDTIRFGHGAAADPRPVRVKGTYRALASDVVRPFWTNFVARIYPVTLDDSPPPPFLFVSRQEFFRLSRALDQDVFGSVHELPVDPSRLTLAGGRALERRLAGVTEELLSGRSDVAREVGCVRNRVRDCTVVSSLSAAVALAEDNIDAISPVVTLLSDLGLVVTLAITCIAGAFAVRRRRTEAALMFARGEHVAAFSARTALEAVLPMLAGALVGFGVAVAVTDAFAPRGTLDESALRTGLAHAGVAELVGLALVAAAAGYSFLRLHDTGARSPHWLRHLPWELPLLAVGVYLLVDIRSGGGLATSGVSDSEHPTLAVFVLPLLLIAGVAGAAARLLRFWLLRRSGRVSRLPTPAFLAVRRLAAARGLVVALVVVLAASLGGSVYAAMLSSSLDETTVKKGYIGIGGDVSGQVGSATLPRSGFAYPATTVSWGNQAANVNTYEGEQVDVLTVDPATLPGVLHWERSWGPNPTQVLRRLGTAPSLPLPVVLVGSWPRTVRALSTPYGRFPVVVLDRLSAFPGMTTHPLAVTSARALADAGKKLRVFDPLGVTLDYVWVKGPRPAASKALTGPPFNATAIVTIDEFRSDPDVLLATRTYSYLRLMAIGSALLSLVGLLLYLQARQRQQALASALSRRMGLRRRTEIGSLFLEIATLLSFSFVVGAAVAITTALPVIRHVDLLPDFPPGPVATIPWPIISVAVAALVVLAAGAAAVTSWFAGRTDVGAELRVA